MSAVSHNFGTLAVWFMNRALYRTIVHFIPICVIFSLLLYSTCHGAVNKIHNARKWWLIIALCEVPFRWVMWAETAGILNLHLITNSLIHCQVTTAID